MSVRTTAAQEATKRRLAGLGLTLVMIGALVLSIAFFNRSFTRTETLTVYADRAGLVMDADAKVRYRGVEVGRVASISYEGDRTRLNLEMNPDTLGTIPADARVEIRSNTVFGAKGINFIAPARTDGSVLAAGDTVQAGQVTTEINTLFQRLNSLLRAVHPDKLKDTMGAITMALRGQGAPLGQALDDFSVLLDDVNPLLPQLQDDLRRAAAVAQLYAGVMPDVLTTVDNATVLGNIVVSERDNFTGMLLSVTGLGSTGGQFLEEHGDATVTAIRTLRPSIDLAGEYSSSFTCMIVGLDRGRISATDAYGATNQPGLYFRSGLVLGGQSYRNPQHLPQVRASGGPRCLGLPGIGGNGNNANYLVTDTGYNPYPPGSERYRNPTPPNAGRPGPPSFLTYLLGPAPDGRSW